MKQEIKKKIIQTSISLEEYGFNDLAWNKEDAEDLIHEIMKDEIGILGGDVYKLTPKRLEPLYDIWACEINKDESQKDYQNHE